MTDNEIVKALECCGKNNVCNECPFASDSIEDCIERLAESALVLINRQKAEIERLQALVEAAEDYLHPLPFKNAFDVEIEKAKAEAIKEFAERLKSKIENLEYKVKLERRIVSLETLRDQVNWVLHEITPNTIDNLAKEMTEETKNE